jgi:hypothetical protein
LEQQATSSESAFKKWYRRNRAQLSQKRKERYQKDKKYRARQLKASKQWRRDNPEYRQRKRQDRSNRLTISDVAIELDSCPQTIRSIEARGLIPVNKQGTGHRIYTRNQVALMQPLVLFLQTHHYRSKGYDATIQKLSKKLKAQWNNK